MTARAPLRGAPAGVQSAARASAGVRRAARIDGYTPAAAPTPIAPARPPVTVNLDESGITWSGGFRPVSDGATVPACLDTSRREQLKPYAAPPALLFITAAGGQAVGGGTVTLTTAGRLRIAEVSALVLLLTVAVTVAASAG